MKKRHILRMVVLLAFLAGGIVWAQVTTGTISGTVRDSTGAVMPGITVLVLNEDTGISRTVEADATGRYSAPSLNLGGYRVTVTREGFQTEVRSGIVLTVGQEAVVDLSLAVGSTTQTVEVSGHASLVESTTASLSSLVDERSIRALPLNGRSYDQLALLQPGVILTDPGPIATPFQGGSGKRFSVGGQRSNSNNFLLDGTNISDEGNGTPGGAAGTNLGVDTILEFKIFTNSYKAEFGRTDGAVVSAITRTGTNTLHGTAFEYIRNSVLDARNFFDLGSSPPPFRRNQFGGVLGGPIRKDKTFFFVGYEGLRQALESTRFAGWVGAPSHGLQIAPDGKTLWDASKGGNAIFIYSLPELKLQGHVPLGEIKRPGKPTIGAFPHWIAFTPDGKTAYVANRWQTMTSITESDRFETNGKTANIETNDKTANIADGWDPNKQGSVSVIDVKTLKVVADIPIGASAERIITLVMP